MKLRIEADVRIHKDSNESKEILSKLNLILFNQSKLMALIDDLKQKVADIQASLDAEQEQIKAAIAALEAQIEALTAQLAGGATPAQIQEVIDSLEVIKTDLEGTVPDAPPAE